MAVISCGLHRLVFKKEDTITLLKSLSLYKGFEIVEPVVQATFLNENSIARATELGKELAKTERVLKYLTQEQDSKNSITSNKVELTVSKYNDISLKINEVYELLEYQDMHESSEDKLIENSKTDTQNKIEIPSELLSSELIFQKAVKVDNSRINFIQDEIKNIEPISYEVISEDKEYTTLLLMSLRVDQKFVENFIDINSEGLEIIEASSPNNSISEDVQDLEIVESKEEIKISTDLKIEQVQIIRDLLLLEKVAYESVSFVGEYSGENEKYKSQVYLEIMGWIEPETLLRIEKLLKVIKSDVFIEEVSTKHRSDVRTKMQNNWFFRPFELVTQFMGVPGTQEIDPSPVMSIFFLAFFGFALGDAGYGLLMLIGSLAFVLIKKPKGGLLEAMKLIIFCSISTILFGALTGGWFGVDLNVLGGLMGEVLRSMKVLDLQSSIILVLGLSLAVGFFQQLLGVFLEMVTYFKNNQVAKGLWGPGTWLLLLVGSPLVFFSESIPFLEVISGIKNYLIILIVALFAYGQGYSSKKFFLRPIIGIGSLFNLTGYLSNTLSYARLLALGLATGVIASVINLIAGIVGGTDSVFGIVITIIVLLVGHLFNIALNLMGTFVNIVRLQLVEFFPRFFEAKGTALEPINYQPSYIKIPNNIEKFGALFVNISNLFINKK